MLHENYSRGCIDEHLECTYSFRGSLDSCGSQALESESKGGSSKRCIPRTSVLFDSPISTIFLPLPSGPSAHTSSSHSLHHVFSYKTFFLLVNHTPPPSTHPWISKALVPYSVSQEFLGVIWDDQWKCINIKIRKGTIFFQKMPFSQWDKDAFRASHHTVVAALLLTQSHILVSAVSHWNINVSTCELWDKDRLCHVTQVTTWELSKRKVKPLQKVLSNERCHPPKGN